METAPQPGNRPGPNPEEGTMFHTTAIRTADVQPGMRVTWDGGPSRGVTIDTVEAGLTGIPGAIRVTTVQALEYELQTWDGLRQVARF